ncbi:MAG: hypothetical protein ACXIUL_06475 [Wenzhouxiangella sp.]
MLIFIYEIAANKPTIIGHFGLACQSVGLQAPASRRRQWTLWDNQALTMP